MTVPSINVGDTIPEAWFDAVTTDVNPWFPDTGYAMGNLYQPTSIPMTPSQAYWHKFGKIVHCHGLFTMNGTGTAGNPITYPLPTTSVIDSVGGSWLYRDSGVKDYWGIVVSQTTTTVAFVIAGGGPTARLGTSLAVGSGDLFSVDLWYLEP